MKNPIKLLLFCATILALGACQQSETEEVVEKSPESSPKQEEFNETPVLPAQATPSENEKADQSLSIDEFNDAIYEVVQDSIQDAVENAVEDEVEKEEKQ